jgi:succinate dehydrogenase / fumarate reductase membrane anchor subunit
MRYRTPLATVRGLGAAKEGTHHFWMQRLTAVALVPLVMWFVGALVYISTADYATAAAWVGAPWVTVLLVALVVALFHHAQLGMQVIIEDYLHVRWQKLAALIVLKLGAVLLGAACIVAVLRIALGSS